MSVHDPELARIAAGLKASLTRLGDGLARIERRYVPQPMVFRPTPEIAAAVARHMRAHNIASEAEALRHLVARGLGLEEDAA
jgi:hypothetical protein